MMTTMMMMDWEKGIGVVHYQTGVELNQMNDITPLLVARAGLWCGSQILIMMKEQRGGNR